MRLAVSLVVLRLGLPLRRYLNMGVTPCGVLPAVGSYPLWVLTEHGFGPSFRPSPPTRCGGLRRSLDMGVTWVWSLIIFQTPSRGLRHYLSMVWMWTWCV